MEIDKGGKIRSVELLMTNDHTLKFLPLKVWPNCQCAGAMFQDVDVRLSLPVTLNDSDCPTSTAFDCQFWPQFLLRLIHPVFDPFTLALTTSPAPATLVIRTRLKYRKPLIVNLIPPCLRHGTLRNFSHLKFISGCFVIFLKHSVTVGRGPWLQCGT